MASVSETARPATAHTAATSPILQSYTEQVTPVDPVALFRYGQADMGTATYWERPQDASLLVGMGVTEEIRLQGPAESAWVFGEACREWCRLVAGARSFGDDTVGPVLLGGFAFDPVQPATATWAGFPSGLLTLPRLLYRQVEGKAFVTYSVVLPPGATTERAFRTLRDTWLGSLAGARGRGSEAEASESGLGVASRRPNSSRHQPPTSSPAPDGRPDPWQGLVAEAAQAIRAGAMDKVVLARQVRLHAERVVDAPTALRRLREATSSGVIFAVAAASRCFLGATPERLVHLEEARVSTAALAGSRRRGATALDDAALEQDLLRSSKDRWEHAIVVRELTDGLRAAGVEVSPPPRSVVLKLGTVQHLYTPLGGHVATDDITILDLLARLHPSPAVGGYPRGEALAWIRRQEGLDRGWYAGPVGWMDTRGNGDFAVGIRSALLDRYGALLFAGCGIMGDSRPEEEYAESELKLKPMQSALLRH